MSAEINNREYRAQKLKQMIQRLHDGETVQQVQAEFAATFGNVSAEEISQAEQALIEGGLPVEEVQRLCDVHAAVFRGSIEELHRPADPSRMPGHPAEVFKRENRALEKLMAEIRALMPELPAPQALHELRSKLKQLAQIDRHYKKKEHLFFPFMEKYGITAPPKVMWGVDDEIRTALKEVGTALEQRDAGALKENLGSVMHRIEEMIFKEENILLPILYENLTVDEWRASSQGAAEFGNCLIGEVAVWRPAGPAGPAPGAAPAGTVVLPTGSLTVQELTAMMNTLPVDITFIGSDDTVRYFSQAKERIFPRTVSVLGRKVSNCHPPASVKIVEKLIDDLRAGRKDHELFWLQVQGNMVLISYFAVRDTTGTYLGVLEVTQNIGPIQRLKGEKRLVND
jgi:hypothetical protein